jgi:SWI/SNF-related matrix-associated actin-dependent regulator 1 of chromatin subfamily A
VPEGCAYLPYQKAGIAFGRDKDAILNADAPGLGKTIQAIGTVNLLDPAPQNILVICPTSLRLNWQREARKWLVSPHEIEVVDHNDPIKTPLMSHLVITNYERLSRNKSITDRAWDLVIVDEAHYIKNPKAKRSKLCYELLGRTKRKMLLTGTPILNKPAELQPLIGILDPDRFGDPRVKYTKQKWHFLSRYCGAHQEPIPGRGLTWMFDGATHLDELQERLRSTIMIRRLKEDVLTELPPKRRSIVPLSVEWNDPVGLRTHLEALEAAEAELRLARAEDDKIAYNAAAKKLRYANDVAFTEMAAYRHRLALAKVPATLDYIETMLESGIEKVVVFAHHRDVIDALEKAFEEKGHKPVKIYGGVSDKIKDEAVQTFQNDPSCHIFIGNIQAAGVGLTLTAASHVVFLELSWVPAEITQCEDRLHRIGQRDVVFVHQLVIDGTLDAYMVEKVVWKQEIADQALDIVPTFEELSSVKLDGPRMPEKKMPTAVRAVADSDRAWLLQALGILAGCCDGAVAKDDSGFNRMDAAFGSKLARLPDLTDAQYYAAYKMVRKYRRQLPDELNRALRFLPAEKAA